MARLTADQWQEARQRWEADPAMTFEALAEIYPVSRQALSRKAKSDGWAKAGNLRKAAERAQFKADARKVAQVARDVADVAGATAKKAIEATFEASVEIRADVIERHRVDWAEHRKHFAVADVREDFENGKKAKISAEMLLIRQKGERAAYGLETEQAATSPDGADLPTTLARLIEKLPQ